MATVNLGKVVTTPKGNYVSSTPYGILDEVYDDVNNITYVSLKDANTDALTITTSWMVIAKGIGVTTDNNYINADKAKVTALPSTTPGEVDGLALYNTLKTFTDSKGIAGGLALYDTLAIFMAQKGVANGLASTNADNQMIQDALNALSLGGNLASNYAQKAKEPWIAPTLLNGWVNVGDPFTTVRYNINSLGQVQIEGTVSGGTIGQSIFVLPTGFRPLKIRTYSVESYGAQGLVRINPDGSVLAQAGNALGLSMDIPPFYAEQ